jgi:sortase A
MMEPMSSRPETCAVRRRRQAAGAALGLAMLLAVSACGGANEPTADASEPVTTATQAPTTFGGTDVTTAAPTTSVMRTMTLATSTTLPAVTAPPTTTTTLVVELPEGPIDPPADSSAQEPIIEVGSIAIPKIGVDMTMYEGIRLTTLDYGPGHWPGSAMPGQIGNVVVGGHRTSSHRVFRDVDQLVTGDEIVFRDEAGVHTYQVARVEIVDPTAVWIVEPTDTATATLFACHPPGSTAQRIVVFADLVGTTTV